VGARDHDLDQIQSIPRAIQVGLHRTFPRRPLQKPSPSLRRVLVPFPPHVHRPDMENKDVHQFVTAALREDRKSVWFNWRQEICEYISEKGIKDTVLHLSIIYYCNQYNLVINLKYISTHQYLRRFVQTILLIYLFDLLLH